MKQTQKILVVLMVLSVVGISSTFVEDLASGDFQRSIVDLIITVWNYAVLFKIMRNEVAA